MSVCRRPAVWIPAAVLAVATVVFWCTNLDEVVVRQFYSDKPLHGKHFIKFPLSTAQPWKTLYNWGVYPAWILGTGGLLVWIASFVWSKLKGWRDPGLFFALLLIVGPGIMVNLVFKPCWRRPRPHSTLAFGGPREFLPVWQFGSGDDDFSFPSGHAATGFYLMAPAFVCHRRRPWLAGGFLVLGLAAGTTIGLARIVAGGHFPSDVLWSGGIIYFTALALAAAFRFGQERSGRQTAGQPLVGGG
jgi:lipid A 4'-phosphatase